MSTDTMSTTDNQVLAEILETLKGLSPPPILGTMNNSIKTLQGKLIEVIGKVTDSIGKLNTDLTTVIGKIHDIMIGKNNEQFFINMMTMLGATIGGFMATPSIGGIPGGIATGAAIGNLIGTSLTTIFGGGGTTDVHSQQMNKNNPPLYYPAVEKVKESAKAVDNKWTKQVLPDLNDRLGTNKLIPKEFRSQTVAPTKANPTIPLNIEQRMKGILHTQEIVPKLQQVAPPITKQVATVDINQNKELPSFVNPSNIAPVNIPTAIASNNTPRNGSNTSSSSQTTNHHQNVYNIANIDIADGMISDLEDLIQAINRHAC